MFHEVQRFSAVSGLQQNVGKSAYVTKGTLQPEALQFMQDSGLQHETKVRYFRVQMGHAFVKEAFVAPLREAYRRARIAAAIALSIPEKITVLKMWILSHVIANGPGLRCRSVCGLGCKHRLQNTLLF